MSLSNITYTLSNANAILGSTLGYLDDKKNGADTGEALSGAGINLTYGLLGNAMARDIQDRTGSYIGYIMKSGNYSNPFANYQSTMNTFGALAFSQLMSPHNRFMISPFYNPFTPCSGGFFNAGMFGGGCGCGSAFSPFGYYC